MIHKMRLVDFAFKAIKNEEKDIEVRLNDLKRQQIKINDIIEFEHVDTHEIIRVRVIDLHKYKTFDELFNNFNHQRLGLKDEDTAEIMNNFYSKEEQEEFGALGIEIKLIKKILLSDLKCVNEDVNIDEYFTYYNYIRDNMEHPEWLGIIPKDEIINIMNNKNGKIWNYYLGDEIVCSLFYIPAADKTLKKHHMYLDYEKVGSCGPIMVTPKYQGNGLQIQMLDILDKHCLSLGQNYVFTKVHPDNIPSIHNFTKDNYKFVESYESSDGPRNIYLKEIKKEL